MSFCLSPRTFLLTSHTNGGMRTVSSVVCPRSGQALAQIATAQPAAAAAVQCCIASPTEEHTAKRARVAQERDPRTEALRGATLTCAPHRIQLPSAPISADAAAFLAATERRKRTAAVAQLATAKQQTADDDKRRATTTWEAAYRHEADMKRLAADAEQAWRRLVAAGPNASVAQRCYQDALHAVYAFLPLRELLPAVHTCRAWYAAAGNEKGRGLTPRPLQQLQELCVSPLRKHVAHLTHLSSSPHDVESQAAQCGHRLQQ